MNDDQWFGKEVTITGRVVCITDTPEEQQLDKEVSDCFCKIWEEVEKEIKIKEKGGE